MADDIEERPKASYGASPISAIFETLNKMRKMREEQIEEYKNRQYLESQKSLNLSKESQKQFEEFLNNSLRSQSSEQGDELEKNEIPVPEISDTQPSLLPNELDSCDTLQESSITGHLQRCFDDSSQSNISACGSKVFSVPEKIPVFSDLRVPQLSKKDPNEDKKQMNQDVTNGPTITKKPFLKKGKGLERYYKPKSSSSSQLPKKKVTPNKAKPMNENTRLPHPLKLKPALRKTDAPSENVRHIRFDITDSSDDIESLAEKGSTSPTKISDVPGDNFGEKCKSTSDSSNSVECSPEKFVSECGGESLDLSRENKELEEFEILENCAQNSSFNSDSSLVQKILHGEPIQAACSSQKYSAKEMTNNGMSANEKTKLSEFSPPNQPNLIQYNKEIQARKECLQKMISDVNPRMQLLEKEISKPQKAMLDDSEVNERCSTPNEESNLEDRNFPSELSECVSDIGFVDSEISAKGLLGALTEKDVEATAEPDCSCCNPDVVLQNMHSNLDDSVTIHHEENDSVCDVYKEESENELMLPGKSKIHEKMVELQKEIEIYRKLNARLNLQSEEREMGLKKLQKERDDFNKWKETEKKRLETEIQEEKRQMKRERDTFKRFQRLRKDNPTKKERDELNALRQEIEKLQEELKRQKIKYSSDSRRWKSRVDTAEQERDTFKLENIKLNEQCEDLLTALKTRLPRKSDVKSADGKATDDHESVKLISLKKDAQTQTEHDSNMPKDSNQASSISTDIKTVNSKVHFKIIPEDEKNESNTTNENNEREMVREEVNPSKGASEEQSPLRGSKMSNRISNGDNIPAVNLSSISVSVEVDVKEIDHGNRVEKIYASGEKEILYTSGTRKVISADGKSKKFFFYNGDVKEIFSDGRMVYTYVSGVTETQSPDGTIINEFPDGQIRICYPDGQKEIRFANGVVQHKFLDGTEEIRSANGDVIRVDANGGKTTVFANGQKEVRTDKYTRREFPDGSIKILYVDGRVETRYNNGRVRIKDKEGKVLLDTKYLNNSKS